MTIYIVSGSCGEYSDRDEWIVKAFYSEEKARDLVEEATKVGKEIEKDFSDRGEYFNQYEHIALNKIDPKFHYDYSGFNYSIEETELI